LGGWQAVGGVGVGAGDGGTVLAVCILLPHPANRTPVADEMRAFLIRTGRSGEKKSPHEPYYGGIMIITQQGGKEGKGTREREREGKGQKGGRANAK